MTTTDATASPVKCIDVLPVRGGKRQALEWIKHSSDFARGEGFVILTSDRDRTAYAVAECHPPVPHLRGFVFTKVGESKGTDAGRTAYLLSCTPNGNEAVCDCRGFSKWRACRHADALGTLIANRWLEGGAS